MSRYRIAYSNAYTAVPLIVHCAGDHLAHHIADALRAEGWVVEVTKEAECWTASGVEPESDTTKENPSKMQICAKVLQNKRK